MPEYHIYLGADHRGFQKKEELYPLIRDCHENVIVEDLGAEAYDEGDDFNDIAIAVGKAVVHDPRSFGVLLCGSAHGVTMQANRIKGVRAINAPTEASVKAGREHDHANILCLAADELDVDTMEKLVKTFCHTHESEESRYKRRVKRLDDEIAEGPHAGFSTKLPEDSEDDEEE